MVSVVPTGQTKTVASLGVLNPLQVGIVAKSVTAYMHMYELPHYYQSG